MKKLKAVKTGLMWFSIFDFNEKHLNYIRDNYTYPHPIEEDNTFCTFYETDEFIGIPYGDTEKLKRVIHHPFEIEDRSIAPTFTELGHSKMDLRDYQQSAKVEIFEIFRSGVHSFNLSGNPGSGKSFMLANLLQELKVKALVIAHLSMLITQISDEIETATGLKVTKLDAKNKELGDINVATSQFVSRHPDLWKRIKHEIGCIVVDEAESSASVTTLRILQRSYAKYRIFISATFSRNVDKRTEALRDLSGHKEVKLVRKDLLIPNIIMVKCPEYFYNKPSNPKLVKIEQGKFLTNTESIVDKVIKITQASLQKNRQVLIAVDVLKLQDKLAYKLNDLGIKSVAVSSNVPMKQRPKILEDFEKGDVKVLLGFGTLNAGISLPHISTIIRLSTPSSLEKLEQLIGRSVRDFKGKSGAYIVDLVFGGLYYNNRLQFYKRKQKANQYKLFVTDWNKFEQKL